MASRGEQAAADLAGAVADEEQAREAAGRGPGRDPAGRRGRRGGLWPARPAGRRGAGRPRGGPAAGGGHRPRRSARRKPGQASVSELEASLAEADAGRRRARPAEARRDGRATADEGSADGAAPPEAHASTAPRTEARRWPTGTAGQAAARAERRDGRPAGGQDGRGAAAGHRRPGRRPGRHGGRGTPGGPAGRRPPGAAGAPGRGGQGGRRGRHAGPGPAHRVAGRGQPSSGRRPSRPARAGRWRCKEIRATVRDLAAEFDRVVDAAHGTEMARAEHRMRLEQLAGRAAEEFGVASRRTGRRVRPGRAGPAGRAGAAAPAAPANGR